MIEQIIVHVQPGAKRGRVEEVGTGGTSRELRAWVDAPPRDGQANERLLELLAEHLACKRWQLRIVRGAGSRMKIVAWTTTEQPR